MITFSDQEDHSCNLCLVLFSFRKGLAWVSDRNNVPWPTTGLHRKQAPSIFTPVHPSSHSRLALQAACHTRTEQRGGPRICMWHSIASFIPGQVSGVMRWLRSSRGGKRSCTVSGISCGGPTASIHLWSHTGTLGTSSALRMSSGTPSSCLAILLKTWTLLCEWRLFMGHFRTRKKPLCMGCAASRLFRLSGFPGCRLLCVYKILSPPSNYFLH